MKKTKKRGFTIVELVIVIAVIAILAAVMVPTFSNVISKAKESKAMQEARGAWDEYVASVVLADASNAIAADTQYIEHDGYQIKVNGSQFLGVIEASDATRDVYSIDESGKIKKVG